MKQYLITRMQGRIFSFLMNDRKAVEIHCDPENSDSLLGNIYIGRIKNIAKNIGAAFVETAPGVTCHLALDDMKHPVYTKKGTSKLPQAGDELLVQISREGIKTKYPSVTTNITLHGKYVLLTTGNTNVSVSSKLSREKRAELMEFEEEWEMAISEARERTAAGQEAPQGSGDQNGCDSGMQGNGGQNGCNFGMQSSRPYGWLFRTNAGTADRKTLSAELSLLKEQYDALMRQAQFRTCYSCLLKMPAPYLNRLADLYDSDAERIMTDDEALYQEMQEYLAVQHPEDLPKLALYKDRMQSMVKLYSLEHQLEQALQEKVWLKCGGYLIIQPTEALTVVDVNSGKFEGGKKREAAFLRLNLEAAEEIARQLRLRNVSGIIIVDFVNMEKQESRDALLSYLKEELHKDPIPTALVDMTKLSLVEITRKKKEKSLAQCCRE
ncbi:MAG: ribonuclease E/G [Lachnospiraceae bacterium]|nr:ribonuclease E/G [Lachnospiraceae bacterium]